MKKRTAILLFLCFIISFTILEAAQIKGQVTSLPSNKPYSHGAVLLTPLPVGAEGYTK